MFIILNFSAQIFEKNSLVGESCLFAQSKARGCWWWQWRRRWRGLKRGESAQIWDRQGEHQSFLRRDDDDDQHGDDDGGEVQDALGDETADSAELWVGRARGKASSDPNVYRSV